MGDKWLKAVLLLFCLRILGGCEISNNSSETSAAENVDSKFSALVSGTYHGIQEGYFLKNQNGEDMVINGEKVPVPSCDFEFQLNEDLTVRLKQKSLSDQTIVNYQGTFKMVSQDEKQVMLECSLSDGNFSQPVYKLKLEKSNLKGVCLSENSPTFSIEKK